MELSAGVDAATLFINDALTKAGGGTTITLKSPIQRSQSYNWAPQGILFSTGLSIDSSGTSPTGSISYIAE